MKNFRFQPTGPEIEQEQVNFDLRRLQKSIDGQSFLLPGEMSREEFREWMRENARKCRSK